MIQTVDRMTWSKKARAILINSRRMGDFYAIKLMGPDDGTGCLPPGEVKVHQTTFRTTKQKAIQEAIAFCDAKKIRIREFPAGLGY